MKINKIAVNFILISTIFALAFPACGPEKKPVFPKKTEKKGVAAVELIKAYGLSLFPGAELMDQAVKTSKIPVPGTDQPGKTLSVKVLSVTGVADRKLDEVRAFYEKQASNVINEEAIDDSVRFVQMSNVSDFNKALAARVSPIVLINLRRKILTENERLAYQNEYQTLPKASNLDAVQKRRKAQLERFLKDNTFIQINVRIHE